MATINSTTSLVGNAICVVRECGARAMNGSAYCFGCNAGLAIEGYPGEQANRMFEEAAEQLDIEIDGWTEEQREEWLAEYGA